MRTVGRTGLGRVTGVDLDGVGLALGIGWTLPDVVPDFCTGLEGSFLGIVGPVVAPGRMMGWGSTGLTVVGLAGLGFGKVLGAGRGVGENLDGWDPGRITLGSVGFAIGAAGLVDSGVGLAELVPLVDEVSAPSERFGLVVDEVSGLS